MSYIVSMIKYRLYLIWIKGVPDVVHVGLVTLSSFGKFVWEEVNHTRLLDNLLVESLDPDFIVSRRVAEVYIFNFVELLFTCQDGFEMVLGKHFNRWQIELPK